jgi:hypothetical protein
MSNDMVRFVEVDGWQIAVEGMGDTQSKIQDLEAGARLGYKRPRAFRQLVVALIKQGVLTEVYQRHVTWQRPQPAGGFREEKSTEFWLTKSQLLTAAAKSTTPIAKQILDDMVKVFIIVEEKGGMAALAPMSSAIRARQIEAEFLKEMNPLIDKAFDQIKDLESKGAMDAVTASAHRTQLLKIYGGIDLTKAPLVKYESVAQQPSQPMVAMLPVKLDSLQGPGGLPPTGLNVKPTVDRTGFMYAYELGDLFGVTPVIIGQLARGAGIFEKITPVKNEFGISYGVEHGVEGNTSNNWLYSKKSEDILRVLATNYLKDLPLKRKKDSTKRFAVEIGKRWKELQPLVEPTTAPAPN